MPVEACNKHVNNLISNMAEVDRLAAIHSQITTKGPGRKHAVEVLHKSGIVLVVACWEAFVEDLAAAALDFMIVEAKDHEVFPRNVLERVASKKTGIDAWKLAGTGWRTALRDNFKEVLARTTGTLNSPRAEQVNELFSKTIGHPDLSATWSWKGRSSGQSSQALNDLITLRGSIAHRVAAASRVQKGDVARAKELIYRLAVRTHNTVCGFLVQQIGKCPWSRISYGKTK